MLLYRRPTFKANRFAPAWSNHRAYSYGGGAAIAAGNSRPNYFPTQGLLGPAPARPMWQPAAATGNFWVVRPLSSSLASRLHNKPALPSGGGQRNISQPQAAAAAAAVKQASKPQAKPPAVRTSKPVAVTPTKPTSLQTR
jgi:hypothetical protein